MDKKKSRGQIAGEVPQALIDEFDGCINRLGMTKKRAIAAALYAFIAGGADAQYEWQRLVHDSYYANGSPGQVSGSAADVGKRVAAAVSRRGSKKRRTSGKSLA